MSKGDLATLSHQSEAANEIEAKAYHFPDGHRAVVFLATCGCGHVTAVKASADQARAFAADLLEQANEVDGGRGLA